MRLYDGEEKKLSSLRNLEKSFAGPDKLIYFLSKPLHFNDEPRFPNYIAGLSKENLVRARSEDIMVGAIDLSEEKARIKTIIEALERHCLFCPDAIRSAFFCEALQLVEKPTSPDHLIRIGNKYNTKKTKIFWSRAFDILNKKQIYVPSQCMCLFYHYSEARLFPLISTGAAAGTKYSGATYRAICEILERDAFMIHYLNKISPPQINAAGIDESVDYILNKFELYNLKAKVLDITTENNVPSFLSILVDTTNIGPYFTFGLKSDLNAIEAIKGSLLEAHQGREWIRENLLALREGKIKTDTTYLSSQIDRALFWSDKKMQNNLHFFIKTNNKTEINSQYFKGSNKRLKILLRLLSEAGVDCIALKDISCNHIKGRGIKVVKVFMPQMQPLYLDERFKCFTRRTIEVPQMIGYTKKSYAELNKIPQPFI